MAIKIRISYNTDEELKRILDRLGDEVKLVRLSRQQEGKYRKAYVEIKKVWK